MLIGAPNRPVLPDLPPPGADTRAIREYLALMHHAISVYVSAISASTVGIINVRGFSSTGIRAENFTKRLAIGGQTSIRWIFTNAEADMSYMLLYSPSATTGMVMTSWTPATTNVLFSFSPAVSSGMFLDLMLVR